MSQSINLIDKMFKRYEDISDEQEHHEKEMDRYRENWTVPFSKPLEIYRVGGNTDSSNFLCAFCVCNVKKNKKFKNWKQLAKYLRKNGDFVLFYDDDDDRPYKIPLFDMFEEIVYSGNLDPVMFVTADNPMIQWLKNVRGITSE